MKSKYIPFAPTEQPPSLVTLETIEAAIKDHPPAMFSVEGDCLEGAGVLDGGGWP